MMRYEWNTEIGAVKPQSDAGRPVFAV